MGEIRIKDGFSGERSLILPAAVVRQAAADPVLSALYVTDMKINQISSVVGIYDPLYFSRMFSKIIGVSPKKFREELRQ